MLSYVTKSSNHILYQSNQLKQTMRIQPKHFGFIWFYVIDEMKSNAPLLRNANERDDISFILAQIKNVIKKWLSQLKKSLSTQGLWWFRTKVWLSLHLSRTKSNDFICMALTWAKPFISQIKNAVICAFISYDFMSFYI